MMKRLFALIAITFPASLSGVELPEVVDFNDHIQPIISEKCYHCHGPDSSTREPGSNPLRLDRGEYAFLERSNERPPIIKGDAASSEVFQRIITDDPDDLMPPPDSHKKPLNAREIALIRKWIDQGAEYEEHWSFIPPSKPAPPEIDWGHNPLDRFIAAKHREMGLTPSPAEKPARLLRRLTFDLTGLPPTPEEVREFREMAAKDLSTAVEMTVARLLNTDAYAEHFARHWLDAARYADTHGIHIDNYRAIWPYRDWVIQAFRQNMPFDQFTREQIAGDLLPNPTLEQKIATGFNRCMPTTGEGGAIAEEYEAIYAADQVSTTSAIWLGLSTGCAACHDHKFDPISQKDFYSLTAFFRNTTMNAMDRNQAEHPPAIFAPRPEDRDRLAEVEKELAGIEQDLNNRRQNARDDFEAWLATQQVEPIADSRLAGARAVPLTGDESDALGPVTTIEATNLELDNFISLESKDRVTFTGYLYFDGAPRGSLLSRMDTTSDYRGWDLWLEDGKLGSHFIDTWPEKAVKGTTVDPLPRGEWLHFAVIYDGQARPNQALSVFVNGKPVEVKQTHSGKLDSIETPVPVRLGARTPDERLEGSVRVRQLEIFKRKLPAADLQKVADESALSRLLVVPPAQRSEDLQKKIFDLYLSQFDAPTNELNRRREALEKEMAAIKKRGSMTLVMEEKEGEATAHILKRGDYSLEGEKVAAAIPEVFGVDPGDRNLSRKDLADWLVSEKNPLPARVTVNRIWYYFFGRGIVETTEDFGIMGAQPTHPKLLDFLATEFMESGWDLQHVIRLITTSATYQQSGNTTSANREKDGENRYLWRSPRHRLEAEQLRDLALATSGLLVREIGGPSVKPYQPDGIWEAVAMKQSNTRFYKPDSGDGLYRRSLYTFWKRTAAPPNMEILNAPAREVFCVRRDRTNTPLAAFVTMNDPQFVEASRVLAENTLKTEASFSQRLNALTLKLMARTFDNDEQAVVKQAYQDHLTHYRAHPELAEELIAIGESEAEPSLDQAELAAWTLIASQIMNLDETLTK